MSEKYDIVIAGGGHNALVLGCYLAKAGVKVCVVERNEKVGGGVMTREYTLPGFKHDTHSVAHTIIQGNPLIQRDELGLKSKYGLRYVNPDKMTAAIFEDGTILEFYSDLERTCQSIAKFSQRDAEAYRRLIIKSWKTSTCWSWACSVCRQPRARRPPCWIRVPRAENYCAPSPSAPGT
jgi:phytoene dehydrogenase-like protein